MTFKNSNIIHKPKIILPSFPAESLMLGILLTMVGGFLDTYTYIIRGKVFANAQTGNIVLLGISIFEGNLPKALNYILPISAFVLGVFASELMKKNTYIPFINDWERTILILEIIILFIIGFIPKTFSNSIVNVIIAFVTSLQYCCFKKVGNAPYATTMCTGNLRSASLAAYSAFAKNDKAAAKKSIRYFTIIFSFLLGACLSGFFTFLVGVHAVWFVDILLVLTFVLIDIEEMEVEKAEEKAS